MSAALRSASPGAEAIGGAAGAGVPLRVAVRLAWLLAKGPGIVPIPGTKSRARLEENAGAASVALTPAEVQRLEAALPPGAAEGTRYPGRLAPVWE